MLKSDIIHIHAHDSGRYCQPVVGIRSICFAAAIAVCLSFILAPPVNAQANAFKTIYFNGKDFRGGQLIVPEGNEGAADAKRWVVVDVHGAGGPKKGWFGRRLLEWVGTDKVIALAPVFHKDYHLGDGEAAEQLIERFEWIKQRYNVHDRMFLHGFSGGAQFVHRFAFNHPELVVGVSAHSAGSWAGVEGWGDISEKAKMIPFVLSCGERDTEKAFGGKAPHGRLAWMKLFAEDLKKRGFVVRAETWPERGHGIPLKDLGPLIRECFLLSTEGVIPKSGKWSGNLQQFTDDINGKGKLMQPTLSRRPAPCFPNSFLAKSH